MYRVSITGFEDGGALVPGTWGQLLGAESFLWLVASEEIETLVLQPQGTSKFCHNHVTLEEDL